MALNLPAKIQRHFRKSNFATELLSPFLRILSPFLRPVNKQLIKADEREVLKRLVDIMIHFQLTFVQEKTEDGQFLYRLEPYVIPCLPCMDGMMCVCVRTWMIF